MPTWVKPEQTVQSSNQKKKKKRKPSRKKREKVFVEEEFEDIENLNGKRILLPNGLSFPCAFEHQGIDPHQKKRNIFAMVSTLLFSCSINPYE